MTVRDWTSYRISYNLIRFLYYVGAITGTAGVLGIMIRKVRLDVSESCWNWFKWTIRLTGGTLSLGLLWAIR